jgi:hypothetical protein
LVRGRDRLWRALLGQRPGEKGVEPRHRFHQANPVVLRLKPFVDLHEWDNTPLAEADWLAWRSHVLHKKRRR